MENLMRLIPPIHELMEDPTVLDLQKQLNMSNSMIKSSLQEATTYIRNQIRDQQATFEDSGDIKQVIMSRAEHTLLDYLKPNLMPVINGTGTVLHTNLGRARLAESAIEQMVKVAKQYSTLEYDVESGKRGSRNKIVEQYIKDVTGAEAAIVVNNNAASVYMVLSAFSKGHEAIVSRGELVEIGGSFRISSIMEESGTRLREIGTTNKTHLYDFQQAINEETNMIMKVHTSNFHMIGFTQSVPRHDLVSLAHDHHLIYYEDLGSGMIYDLSQHGIGHEPLVKDVIESGADLVSFSGDKLLGGPQVGIIAGKKKWIDQLKKHQLARVLRVDKMTYAALEETLKLLIQEKHQSIPTIRDILVSQDELKSRVQAFMQRVPHYIKSSLVTDETKLISKVGGGTLPEIELPSYGIRMSSQAISAEKISEQLRRMDPVIIVRVEQNDVIMDFRTISQEEEDLVLNHLIELSNSF
ncbi:L-seryl-tRNA(Sec) selenium transferase [Tenuibacillus multivorans]|uniref:L-seryl-tRNA(Sec) selenium transferase n=1 Tax=Tenuibacillus multivorans TaxID=237069 RepID=A0A1H0CI11_9BACI|nr:L-seryl-tRNA(Sec) selenium transferase [Tenuibacillus multivorans]GEL76290.1 L-seryl-tRNA(Sec) selenium transferase [Tenuibacillus multivorans]SDN57453.1 L-seryl-tRNA(Ser) seleniumtransferase [Tenuibacillus multivorans]